MSFIYDVLFIIFLMFSLPSVLYQLIFKGKYRQSLKMRMGLMPRELWQRLKDNKDKKVIWLHAVSVGEMIAASSLLPGIRETFPGYRLVISTTTETGQAIACQKAAEGEEVFYFPLDLSFIARRFIRHINPAVFLIMETELWPNVIWQMIANRVKIVIVNGRLSPGSYCGYKLIRRLMTPLLSKMDLFCMQGPRDAGKIISLGAKPNKVKITGNIKIDQALVENPDTGELALIRSKLSLKENGRLLVAGSTHPGEEEMILKVYKKMRPDFPDLKLLIAPRHIERTAKIENLVKDLNMQAFKYTDLLNIAAVEDCKIIILDVIGVLKQIYSLATVVFVGGSLVRHGGQNILEPAAMAKPVIFGPHIYNFQDVADLFLAKQAEIQVHDKYELEHTCRWLLSSPRHCGILGRRARAVVEENAGALQKNIEILKDVIN